MSPKIAEITVSRHRLVLDPPFPPAWDSRPRHHFDVDIVRVVTDTGETGIGSGDAMAGFDAYRDLFIGRAALDLDRHAKILDNVAFHAGRCWPLDIALWDLAGKLQGQPIWRLVGGAADRVRAYASCGVLRDGAATADLAERLIEAGFAAMKIRFHRADWRDDVAAVAAVRARVGDRLALMVDCNQGWRMPWDTATPWPLDRALQVARALEELQIYWIEEPLHRGDHAGMAALRAAVSIPIAGGEMTRERHEFDQLIERGCLDVLQPDAVLTGGISGLKPVAEAARARGLIFTPHTWGNGIGLAANLHLAAGVAPPPFIEYPFDPPEWTPERRDFPLTQPILADGDGWLTLSDRPGLGIELDEARLARTRIV